MNIIVLLPAIKQPERETDNLILPDDKLIRGTFTPLHPYASLHILVLRHLDKVII
jgi:hypothetical protein